MNSEETKKKFRRVNLQAMIDEGWPSVAEFCRQTGLDDKRTRNLLNENLKNPLTFTGKAARKIEEAAGWSDGVLDMDPKLRKSDMLAKILAVLDEAPFLKRHPAWKAQTMAAAKELQDLYNKENK